MIKEILEKSVVQGIKELYSADVASNLIQIQKTRREFTGDLTVITFPFLKISRKSPEATAQELGEYLLKHDSVSDFNVIKGFLNLTISDSYWIKRFNEILPDNKFGFKEASGETVLVEYSSPNTNKPLHLGHIRNNLLGYAVSEILKANGKKVVKTNIVNDRGIHICKSMLAWKKWGNADTPYSTGEKGDHLVGDYYVKFDKEYKKQVKELVAQGTDEDEARRDAPLMKEAQELLRMWEAKDPEVYKLWETMNQWVYDGFDVTYKRLGVDFDKIYYESETYLVGKETVLKGLEQDVIYRRDDNSVWIDLTNDGLDEKLLLRSDGTSVYMTQDIGTAQMRQNDYNFEKCVYVVGNEQDYHFKVLSIILDKLGFSWAKGLFHLSYGMVELPEGKMKSREGTVVDADDLMDEMIGTAREMSEELGKLDGFSKDEQENIFRIIGLGALKYFMLKVDPKKNMTFDPKESIDFNGNTGPFIQYTYARIRSILRKAKKQEIHAEPGIKADLQISSKEKNLIKLLNDFPEVLNDSAENYSPAGIANYAYELVKEYNQFYHEHQILKEDNRDLRNFRLNLSEKIASILENGLGLLGIEMPERM